MILIGLLHRRWQVLVLDSRPGTRGSSRGSVSFQRGASQASDARPASSKRSAPERPVSSEDAIRPFPSEVADRGILARPQSSDVLERGSSRGSVRFGLPLQTSVEHHGGSELDDPAAE
eukprot:2268380-Rhodomonas_salina.1